MHAEGIAISVQIKFGACRTCDSQIACVIAFLKKLHAQSRSSSMDEMLSSTYPYTGYISRPGINDKMPDNSSYYHFEQEELLISRSPAFSCSPTFHGGSRWYLEMSGQISFYLYNQQSFLSSL